MLDRNARNHLTVCKKKAQLCLEMCLEIFYLIYVCKEDLALNNLQSLICNKPQTNQILLYLIYVERGFSIK